MSETWLTTAQVAERLQMSQWTVRRLLNKGELRGSYIGRGYRVAPTDLETFMARKVGAKPVNARRKRRAA